MKRLTISGVFGLLVGAGFATEYVIRSQYNHWTDASMFTTFITLSVMGCVGLFTLLSYAEIWGIIKVVARFIWRPINRELATRQIKKAKELYDLDIYSEREYKDKVNNLKLKL